MNDRRLYVDAIDVKPLDYPFDAEHNADYGNASGPGWETVLPDVDEWTPAQCYAWLREQNYADSMADVPELSDVERGDTDAIINAWRAAVRDGMANTEDPDYLVPVMSYAYPLPNLRMTAEQAQARVLDTSCVVVNIDDVPYLALAGGGMDLSWEICRAYIALGYYPPAHFARDLPDQGETDVETATICAESCRILAEWAIRWNERARGMVEKTADRKLQAGQRS